MGVILCTAVWKDTNGLLKKFNTELYLFARLDILFIGSAYATLVVKSVDLNKGNDFIYLIFRSSVFRQILLRISGQQM